MDSSQQEPIRHDRMTTMEQSTGSPSPFGTFDAMSLAPVHDMPQLTISPSQTTLELGESKSSMESTPEITVSPPCNDAGKDQKVEKKPVKKRKSWGQELPVPKTNLPPRKRAKTEDEKEQRRIERVLRNRAAAQTSRERKRLEVEKIEGEKQEIERQNAFLLKRLSQIESENTRLSLQVAKLSSEIQSSSCMTPKSIDPSESESPTLAPILFKQERDDLSMDKIPLPSPTTHGLPGNMDATGLKETSNMTQHPAAVLCDLQCQLEEDLTVQKASRHQFNFTLQSIMQHLFLMMTSAAYSTVILPMTRIFHSLKAGSPLTFSPEEICQHLPLILWLISTPTLSTSTVSRPRSVLRIRLLTRLLECSPAMARPLRDATSRALRLAAREESSESRSSTPRDPSTVVQDWTLLLTVIWAIDRIERTSLATTESRPRSSRIKKSYRYHNQDPRVKQMHLKRLRSLRSRGMRFWP